MNLPAQVPAVTAGVSSPLIAKFGILLNEELIKRAIRVEFPYLLDFERQDKSGAVRLGVEALVKTKLLEYSQEKGSFKIEDGVLLVVEKDGSVREVPYQELSALAVPQNTSPSAGLSADQLTKQLISEALRVQAASFSLEAVQKELLGAGFKQSTTLKVLSRFADDDGKVQENYLGKELKSRIIEQAIKSAV